MSGHLRHTVRLLGADRVFSPLRDIFPRTLYFRPENNRRGRQPPG